MKSSTERFRVAGLYSLFYAGQFMLLGIQLPFFAGWLAMHDFKTEEIGIITALALVARLGLGPLIAYWADHLDDERTALRAVSFLFAAGAFVLSLALSKPMIMISAGTVIFSFGVLMPLTDTAVLRADRNGFVNYGFVRAMGSAWFLIAALIGGEVLDRVGIGWAGALMAGSASLSLLVSFILPVGVGHRGGEKPSTWSEAPRLVAQPAFLLCLFSAGLTQGAHAVYYAFSFLRWNEIGYSSSIIGALWATGVIAEILVLTRARGLALRLSPAILLGLGGAGAFFRWGLTAIEPPLAVLFVVQTLHALTFASAYLGVIEFLDRATPKKLINTGMTLMSTTGVGAITGIATFASGYIWSAYGASVAYMVMAMMGGGAFVLALILGRSWNGRQLSVSGNQKQGSD